MYIVSHKHTLKINSTENVYRVVHSITEIYKDKFLEVHELNLTQ